MLEHSLFELAGATCFCGAMIGKQIRDHLLSEGNYSNPTYRSDFHKNCLGGLRNDLDVDYPRRFRLNDMYMALEALWPKDIFFGPKGANLYVLDNLFAQLFVVHGDVIHYRDEQVQEYARCAARLDPAIIVGWHVAKRIRRYPNLSCSDLVRVMDAQRPFFSPPPTHETPYAENHVHLGGAHYDGLVLMSTLTEELGELESEPCFESLRQLQRLAGGMLNDINVIVKNDDVHIRQLCRQSFGKGSQDLDARPISWNWLADEQAEVEEVSNLRWLRKQIARCLANGNITKAWLWFIVMCWAQYQDPYCSSSRRMAIFLLFNSLMGVRRQLLMDGQGLTRFVEVYNRKPRWLGKDKHTVDAAKRIFDGQNDVAEIKVTRAQFNPEQISIWIKNLRSATGLPEVSSIRSLAVAEHAIFRQSLERWHFSVHFLRSVKMRHKPRLAWKEAEGLAEQMRSDAGWERPDMLTTSPMWSGRLQPSRWVRSIDVAGDENAVKTEIFAPSIRWLRSGMQNGHARSAKLPGLYLSVHAGEDYAHPLSGMRHVDETVQFCEMRSGDRLGHALALGVEPKVWFERHGEAVLDLDEYVDNLIWAWHYACDMSTTLPFAAQVLPKFERTISRLLPRVTWLQGTNHLTSTSLEDLFRAWFLRRNCYHYVPTDKAPPIYDEKLRAAVPDLNEFLGEISPSARLYLKRWRAFSAPSFSSAKQGRDVEGLPERFRVRVRYSDRDSHSHCQLAGELRLIQVIETSLELEFMHALQDWLLDNYDRKGLIIEANPTSNVYIGKFTSHAEHPIFRWYPPDEQTLKPGSSNNVYGLRRGPIKLCINTDDPGIMPTTLRTEFALLREAALAHGVSRTYAEEWLERIRLFGIAQFQQKHEPLWE